MQEILIDRQPVVKLHIKRGKQVESFQIPTNELVTAIENHMDSFSTTYQEYINPKVSRSMWHNHFPNPAKTPLNDRDLASDNTSLRQYPMTPDECYPFKHLSNDPDSVLYCPLAGLEYEQIKTIPNKLSMLTKDQLISLITNISLLIP